MARASASPAPLRHDPYYPTVIWQSRDYRPDGTQDLPPLRHEYEAILQQCRTAVARREKAYPQLVREKRLDPETAGRDLDAWRVLATEWQWIVTGEGEAPHHASLPARIDAVALALDRVGAEIQRAPTDSLLLQRAILEGLAWHLGDGRAGPAIHHTARINHALRARRAAQAQRSAA
ncbi:hypothetical protein [Novosphingobium sp. 9]|uniref:hypothetical protein n=1 Tax=Novosphingobium sp. 9 TaxID=2025349 RepID=UPI0021B5DA6A|nr:hypothetical protein [Novosphingobium sp. 9]